MIEKRRSLRNDAAYMLAVLYTCGFLGMCFLMVLRDIGPESRAVVQQLISIMSMIQASIAGYFYGASKSSTVQAEAMTRIAEAPTTLSSAQTGPIQAGSVAVETQNTTITEKDKP